MTFSCFSAGLTVEEDDLRHLLLPRSHPREEEVWTTWLEHQGQCLSPLSLFLSLFCLSYFSLSLSKTQKIDYIWYK